MRGSLAGSGHGIWLSVHALLSYRYAKKLVVAVIHGAGCHSLGYVLCAALGAGFTA